MVALKRRPTYVQTSTSVGRRIQPVTTKPLQHHTANRNHRPPYHTATAVPIPLSTLALRFGASASTLLGLPSRVHPKRFFFLRNSYRSFFLVFFHSFMRMHTYYLISVVIIAVTVTVTISIVVIVVIIILVLILVFVIVVAVFFLSFALPFTPSYSSPFSAATIICCFLPPLFCFSLSLFLFFFFFFFK